MNRRKFGLATTVAFAGTVAGSAASDSMKIGTPHIGYIQDLTRRLWEHDNQFGGGGIARYALEQYWLARRWLDYGEFGSRTGADLASATGWLSNTAAWLARDSGRPDSARQSLGESVLLAEQYGDTSLLAAALGDLANLAVANPVRSREPVRLACRASELARHVPSRRLNALRAAEESTAHAAVGDSDEFERAIVQVWREVDRGLDGSDDPAWLDHVTEAELRVHEARGRRLLGQHHRAADLFRESITRPGNRPRDEASYRTYFAASLAGLGDITEAITAADSALDLLDGPVQSPRLLSEIGPVREAARDTLTGPAARFCQRYDWLTSANAG
ncbi:hypothetical protein [Nocardia cyriacigeorgica]|uniref:hypothetical protein n=1 Tax=Nocardia cyriacigeorgica TaxID=135487 RepID=UPI0021154613|nr:hypothetical protein [Nocardia cyriacigeorgica]